MPSEPAAVELQSGRAYLRSKREKTSLQGSNRQVANLEKGLSSMDSWKNMSFEDNACKLSSFKTNIKSALTEPSRWKTCDTLINIFNHNTMHFISNVGERDINLYGGNISFPNFTLNCTALMDSQATAHTFRSKIKELGGRRAWGRARSDRLEKVVQKVNTFDGTWSNHHRWERERRAERKEGYEDGKRSLV